MGSAISTRLASPDTGITTYVPDAAGNVVGSTDARGLATTYVYDALNRQTLATFSGGSVALEYDNTATGGRVRQGSADQGHRSVGHHDLSVRRIGSRGAQDADGGQRTRRRRPSRRATSTRPDG